MTDHTDDLIERRLEQAAIILDKHPSEVYGLNQLCREARAEITALRAKLTEAMEALTPFAAENDISSDAPDDAYLSVNSGDMHVAYCMVGHLRAARRLVDGERE